MSKFTIRIAASVVLVAMVVLPIGSLALSLVTPIMIEDKVDDATIHF